MRGVCRSVCAFLLAHPAVGTQGCRSRVAPTTQFHALDGNSKGVPMLLGAILSCAQSCWLLRQQLGRQWANKHSREASGQVLLGGEAKPAGCMGLFSSCWDVIESTQDVAPCGNTGAAGDVAGCALVCSAWEPAATHAMKLQPHTGLSFCGLF